jgi:hypothetical protein
MLVQVGIFQNYKVHLSGQVVFPNKVSCFSSAREPERPLVEWQT